MTELDNFIASQAKMTSIYKEQGKSINLLNLRYKILNKSLGPFYKLYIDVKNTTETTADLFAKFADKTDEVTESVDELTKPFGKFLGFLKQVNTIMIFVLGIFALLGAAIFLLTKQFGGGEVAAGAFGDVLEAGRSIVDAFMGAIGAVMSAIGNLDFSSVGGLLIPMLEQIFSYLGSILQVYFGLIGAVLTGIGDIVARMDEAGMFQRILDAFGMFLGLVAVAFNTVKQALDDTGVTVGGIIDFFGDVISGFVDFLFSSGIIDFAVTVIEYVGMIAGVVVNLFGIFIAVFIRVAAKVAPPLIKLVKTIFSVAGPILKLVLGVVGGILKAVMGMIQFLMPAFEKFGDFVMIILTPIIEAIKLIEKAVGFVGDVAEGAGKVVGKVGGFLGFSDGGVATGPSSGYPVTLHGTEAIVPLPDGRTIPVSIKADGAMGGSNTNNININVKGGGNAKEIAKAVSDEVSKVLRTRKRGGGFTRGVI